MKTILVDVEEFTIDKLYDDPDKERKVRFKLTSSNKKPPQLSEDLVFSHESVEASRYCCPTELAVGTDGLNDCIGVRVF